MERAVPSCRKPGVYTPQSISEQGSEKISARQRDFPRGGGEIPFPSAFLAEAELLRPKSWAALVGEGGDLPGGTRRAQGGCPGPPGFVSPRGMALPAVRPRAELGAVTAWAG